MEKKLNIIKKKNLFKLNNKMKKINYLFKSLIDF